MGMKARRRPGSLPATWAKVHVYEPLGGSRSGYRYHGRLDLPQWPSCGDVIRGPGDRVMRIKRVEVAMVESAPPGVSHARCRIDVVEVTR